jgi:hypothetical protein
LTEQLRLIVLLVVLLIGTIGGAVYLLRAG